MHDVRFLLVVFILVGAATHSPIIAAGPDSPKRAYPIAGLDPSERPVGAPTITKVERSWGWERRFFYGVSKPYPFSKSFSADQGAWFTPFDHPGMTAPYDPRGWHD